ncbi:NAD(P)-dependent oxidoreductase [Micromonospora sp. NBC_01796]|uniref:NAD(P)-dependent oxidoreductase n=1 Tax=Micromonospora sp. NBC_01796 TaxID=2975987 RepID=UPI002DDBDFCB|nr:NAD(P)H-binding protein [Micromonospora sp. NBC_01796]WSA84543.1 NAD(P)H-binding protein [Micromonospora sp. NBC_01796]
MSDIAIFGAGGRAGRAVTREARDRGHRVTAVVRDPERFRHLSADGVRVLRGDVTDVRAVALITRDHDAVVHAVSPASGPEALARLDRFDGQFFVRAADALRQGMAEAGVSRLVVIGLFANLDGVDGRPVMDDPALFPATLRPFARAHTDGLDRLRTTGGALDWVMLTPPAMLSADSPRTGRYRVGGDAVPPSESAWLSYADLAVAVLDEIGTPRHHRTRVSVYNTAS